MFDTRTPKEITNDILSRIDKIDKRQSSTVYQSASAIAYELRNINLLLEYFLRQTFLKTAEGVYLDDLAKQYQFTREAPTKAVVKAEIVGNTVPIGNRFASVGLQESIIYKVIEQPKENNNIYTLEAEELNSQANYYLGDIAIIDFLPNISKAKIIELVYPQKEEENDEDFRKRVQENLIAEATDGNKQQYKRWLSEFKGVGKNKVTSLWNGANTVKCTILNDLNKSASTELIEKVQNYLDPNSQGLGEGKAPIGAIVTVDTGTDINININLQVIYKTGRNSAPTLKDELNEFFSNIAFERSTVSYLQIAGIISNNIDIDYIVSLTLNGQKKDISLENNQVPVLGDLNVN